MIGIGELVCPAGMVLQKPDGAVHPRYLRHPDYHGDYHGYDIGFRCVAPPRDSKKWRSL
ncbi:MAG: hypothetical protein BWY40_00075 [bacterium ADurb.Bin270]|nr:hypothetical protein [Myxococcales bacterium]OQA62294.1 MAG: hypothetical protein BWY40_00075 [bacterium ADurb.Bin270]